MARYAISENTKEVFLKGKLKWAKGLFQMDEMYNKWSCKLYLDDESLDIVRELQGNGLRNQIKKDDDGWYTSISRPTQKVMKGIVKPFFPPVVEDKDGNPITSNIIGNGSSAICKMEVYWYTVPGSQKRSVAYRLASVRVIDLIKFERENDFDEYEKAQSAGITEQEMIF